MLSLDDAYVREITVKQAKPIILRYEWLGTMNRPQSCYGLFSGRKTNTVDAKRLVDESGNAIILPVSESLEILAPYVVIDGEELIGVACLGWPGGVRSRDICGEELRAQAIALERGTCVHWAHPHSASFMIPKVCRAAHEKYGYSIFYAYSDSSAGEVGTIYQACNWHYIGQGVGRDEGRMREKFVRPTDNHVLTSRALRHHKLKKNEVLTQGWKVIKEPAKHKYVWFEGKNKKSLRAACRYPFKPYPKWDTKDEQTVAVRQDLRLEDPSS